MPKKIKDFEELKSTLKSYLPEFLEKMGIKRQKNNAKFFQSFYSETEDKHPSLHIFESKNGETMYHCFSTGRTGDIFIANSIINKAPLIGYEFMTDNVKPLCEMFDIDYEFRPLTPEEIEEMNIRSVYSIVKDTIVSNLRFGAEKKNYIKDKVLEYINERKIDIKLDSLDFSLGYVPSYDDFISDMEMMGIDKKYLDKIGIKKYVFDNNNLLFAVLDEKNFPRGFAARNCLFMPENAIGSKYYNTENNLIYQKGSLLYNLNRAIRKTTGGSLYISEGYTDAIALDKAGFRSVALGSTKFTNEHISLLQRVGESDIVFILDGDKPGIENTANAITTVMEGIRNFRVRIVTLPDEHDPESFLRAKGRNALLELPHLTAFEWRLLKLQTETDLDGHELAKQMIPLIVNETSELERDRMSKHLSDICDIPIAVVRKEVNLISDTDKIKQEVERDAIVDNLVKSLKKSPAEAQFVIAQALDSIKALSDRSGNHLYDGAGFMNELFNIKLKQETAAESDHLYLWKMPRFEKFNKASMAGKLMLLGGEPHAGKTTFIVNWIIAILNAHLASRQWDQEGGEDRFNNVCIFYHTVDDALVEVIPRFLSAIAFDYSKEANIGNMDNPNFADVRNKEKLLYAREQAYKMMFEWAKDERLIIKDAAFGNNLSAASAQIKYLKDKYPDRHIIYVVDNLFNLTDFQEVDNETKRIKDLTNLLKSQIIVPNKITGLATVEYRKDDHSGRQVTGSYMNNLIKDSKSLQYLANWIGHLINELHSNPDNTDLWFHDPTVPKEKRTFQDRRPIIRLIISKNKITGWNGELHYYLFSNQSVYMEMTKDDVMRSKDSLRQRLWGWYGDAKSGVSIEPQDEDSMEKQLYEKINSAA